MAAGTNAGRAGGPVGDIRKLNAIQSKGKDKDWKIEKAIAEGIIGSDFPESLDLREDDWWEISHQGETSSCVGWASTDGLLRWHLVKANRIQKTDKLSVRFTWMAAKETDKNVDFAETFIEGSGTPLKPALDVMRKFGCVLEQIFPFDSGFVHSEYSTTEKFYALAAQLKIKGYYCLQYDEVADIDRFKIWLTHRGPILVLADIDSNFFKPQTDKKMILRDYDKESVDGGHAIVIVGYTKDYFIIRNSWGKDYGDGGYTYASNEYVQAAICEAYGIVV